MTKGITRRAFLKFAAALLAYAGLPPERLIAATSGSGELDTDAEWLNVVLHSTAAQCEKIVRKTRRAQEAERSLGPRS